MIGILYIIACNLLSISAVFCATYLEDNGKNGFWPLIILAFLSSRLPYMPIHIIKETKSDE
jgi:hypothetical protein